MSIKPLAVSVCLAANDGKILLIQRRKGAYVGLWGLPGGKLEFGEHIHEAALREFVEETGIIGQFRDIVATVSEHVIEGSKVVSHFLLFICRLRLAGTPAPKKTRDGLARWFRFEELDRLALVPSDRLFIQEFMLGRGGGQYLCVVRKRRNDYAVERFERV